MGSVLLRCRGRQKQWKEALSRRPQWSSSEARGVGPCRAPTALMLWFSTPFPRLLFYTSRLLYPWLYLFFHQLMVQLLLYCALQGLSFSLVNFQPSDISSAKISAVTPSSSQMLGPTHLFLSLSLGSCGAGCLVPGPPCPNQEAQGLGWGPRDTKYHQSGAASSLRAGQGRPLLTPPLTQSGLGDILGKMRERGMVWTGDGNTGHPK